MTGSEGAAEGFRKCGSGGVNDDRGGRNRRTGGGFRSRTWVFAAAGVEAVDSGDEDNRAGVRKQLLAVGCRLVVVRGGDGFSDMDRAASLDDCLYIRLSMIRLITVRTGVPRAIAASLGNPCMAR